MNDVIARINSRNCLKFTLKFATLAVFGHFYLFQSLIEFPEITIFDHFGLVISGLVGQISHRGIHSTGTEKNLWDTVTSYNCPVLQSQSIRCDRPSQGQLEKSEFFQVSAMKHLKDFSCTTTLF